MERLRCAWAVKDIAFRKETGCGGQHIHIQIRRRRCGGGPDQCVHGPLCIGCDQDDAATGRVPVLQRGAGKGDVARHHLIGEKGAKVIISDFADKGGVLAVRSDTGNGVGGGAARSPALNDERVKHGGGLISINQGHGPLLAAQCGQLVIADLGIYINEGSAHSSDMKAFVRHFTLRKWQKNKRGQAATVLPLKRHKSWTTQLGQSGLRALQM